MGDLFKAIGLVLLWISVAGAVRHFIRSWQARIGVVGHSMEPTLLDGDWLLRDPDAYERKAPVAGDLVVVRDPRTTDRLLIKRVIRVESNRALTLAGDHPGHRGDGEAIGPIWPAEVMGRPWFRYWPARRAGRIT